MIQLLMSVSLVILFSFFLHSQNQHTSRLIKEHYEGCEATVENAAKKLNSIDTFPDFNDQCHKIKASEAIHLVDGITPEKNMILVYRTDQNGICVTKDNETQWTTQQAHHAKILTSFRYGFHIQPFQGCDNMNDLYPELRSGIGRSY